MTVRAFHTKPLPESGESEPVPFVVLLGAGRRTFIRVLAQFKDDEVLGGTPPTVLITAGKAKAAEVTVGDESVPIIGSDGKTVVATATCQRTPEDNDTYLVTIAHDGDAGPWGFVIRNDESNSLQFFGFVSDVEAETQRPWMQLEAVGRFPQTLFLSFSPIRQIRDVRVRNVGTEPLELTGDAGDPLDGPSLVINELPSSPIGPHRTGMIKVERVPDAGGQTTGFLTFPSNDPEISHSTLTWDVFVPEDNPPNRCKVCGCVNFASVLTPGDRSCGNCFHDHSGKDGGGDDFDEGPFGPI